MRRHGIDNFLELVRRSQDDIEWFWDAVVTDLGIDFFRPYEKVLDESGGPQWPKWFVGGRINLTHNCVDRHAAGARSHEPALLWEGEDGAIRDLDYAELGAEVGRAAAGLAALG